MADEDDPDDDFEGFDDFDSDFDDDWSDDELAASYSDDDPPDGNPAETAPTPPAQVAGSPASPGGRPTNQENPVPDEQQTDATEQQQGGQEPTEPQENGGKAPKTYSEKHVSDLRSENAKYRTKATAEEEAHGATKAELVAERRERAAERAARKLGIDETALLDSRGFSKALDGLDPTSDSFAEELEKAITAAADANPRLKSSGSTTAPSASAEGMNGENKPSGPKSVRELVDERTKRARAQ